MKIPRSLITVLPNVVTSLRFIGLPFLVGYIQKEEYLFALVLFCGLAATDFLDGWLARKFNAVTGLGKFLDPAADKFLILPVLFYAMLPGFFLQFLVLAYFEVILFLVACIAFFRPDNPFTKLGANKFGKVKAVSEVVLIVVFMLARLGAEVSQFIPAPLFFFATIMAFLSVYGHIKWWWQEEQI